MVGSHDNQDDGDFNPSKFSESVKANNFFDDVAYFVPFFFLTVCMPTTLFGQNLLKTSAQSFQKIMHNHMQIYYCTVHWMQNT